MHRERLVGESPQQRVIVADKKDAAGSEQARRGARPARELGQPLERARPGDDDVELPVDDIGRAPGAPST